jgi:hypothetical protein
MEILGTIHASRSPGGRAARSTQTTTHPGAVLVQLTAKTRHHMSGINIDTLLREQQTSVLRDRRAVDRQPFVRPMQIVPSRSGKPISGFSRDVSRHGISIILGEPLSPGTIATLEIHRLYGAPLSIKAEVRWCDAFGEGWYCSGWYFLETP